MGQHYRIDGRDVFFRDEYYFDTPQPLPGVDASTFEVLGDWLARDARQVYFLHTVVAGADAPTFVLLGGYCDFWARDRALAYWFWPTKSARRFKVLPSRSVDAFEIVPDSRFSAWARDRETVYYGNGNLRTVRGADPASFRPLMCHCVDDTEGLASNHFTRDRSHIFFHASGIKGVDVERFAVIWARYGPSEFGVDPTQVFYQSQSTGKLERATHEQVPAEIVARWRRVVGSR